MRSPTCRRVCLILLALALTIGVRRLEARGKSDDAIGACLQGDGYLMAPLRRGSGTHLEMTARINGVAGLFLVDTGAQITVVNRSSLGRFRLKPIKTAVRVYGAVGGPGERIGAALAGRIQVGPGEASPFLLGVSELSGLNQGRSDGEDGRLDGIIGADVLQTFGFIIDCGNLRLYGRKDGAAVHGSPGLAACLKRGGFTEAAMQRFSISDFELTAKVNGRPALWLVDTGAAVTLLDTAVSRRAGVTVNRTNLSVGGAGGGRRRIDVGVVDNLRFSNLRVRSAVIAISDISAYNAGMQDDGKPPIDGYLGADFLRAKKAVIDCGQMRLYLAN